MNQASFGDPRLKQFVWDRIVVGVEPECPWMWIGYSDRGYARVVGDDSKQKPYLSRYMYEKFVGPVPDGMQVEHLCHSLDLSCYGGERCPHRLCATPSHFTLVSAKENQARVHNPQVLLQFCVYGHPYTEENTYVGPNGGRFCRQCYRDAHNGADRGPRLGRPDDWCASLNPSATRMVQRCDEDHPLVGTNAVRREDGSLGCQLCLDYEEHIATQRGRADTRSTAFAFGDPRLPRRFWVKLEVTPSGCWSWTGKLRANGGAVVNLDGASWRVHRAAYWHLVGEIPDGLVLDHLCHTYDSTCYEANKCPHRRCANPEHLQIVTRAENNRRMHHYNDLKTHCPQNHEYTDENTRWYRGMRYCIACESSEQRKEKNKEWRAKNRDRSNATQRRYAQRNPEKVKALKRDWDERQRAEKRANPVPSAFQEKVIAGVLDRLDTTGLAKVTAADLADDASPNKTNYTRALRWLVENAWLTSPSNGMYGKGERLLARGGRSAA